MFNDPSSQPVKEYTNSCPPRSRGGCVSPLSKTGIAPRSSVVVNMKSNSNSNRKKIGRRKIVQKTMVS